MDRARSLSPLPSRAHRGAGPAHPERRRALAIPPPPPPAALRKTRELSPLRGLGAQPEPSPERILRSLVSGRPLTAQEAQDEEIDEQFRRLESGAPPRGLALGERGSDAVAHVENDSLFRRMAVNHGKPLKVFMLALRDDDAKSDWLEVVRPLVHNLLKAATALEQTALSVALSNFLLALDAAWASAEPRLEGAVRQRLLSSYRELAAELPLAFAITTQQDQKEPLLVHNLLRLVSRVQKHNMDRLHAAGLNSVSALCACSIADLAELGRLDFRAAMDISQLAHSYCQQQAEQSREQGWD